MENGRFSMEINRISGENERFSMENNSMLMSFGLMSIKDDLEGGESYKIDECFIPHSYSSNTKPFYYSIIAT